jgi:uncharacterized protein YlxW (UPF0749 family)
MAEPAAELLPDRVTTPLLLLITQQSLDEDYQHVADQRSAGQKSASRRLPAVTVGALAVFALLVTIAAVQTSRDAGVRNEDRGQLINRIEARRADVSNLQKDLGKLRTANVAADAAYQEMGQQLSQVESRVVTLGMESGFHALTGPGVRFVVSDGSGQDNEVRDSDLRLLVNGLFAAGAQGVAVNGQRVTALSSLRNSGTVVRINNVSLTSPYTVEAVGDERTLQARFSNSTTGVQFRDQVARSAMPFTMQNVNQLTLPAAPTRMRDLRYADQGTTGLQRQRMIKEDSTP